MLILTFLYSGRRRYGEAVPMQGYGVFSFARYFGDDETDFPIDYGPPGHLDKINGDALLPGMQKLEARPPARETPNAVVHEGAWMDAIAEGKEEHKEAKDELGENTGADEETNVVDNAQRKKKRKKKLKKKKRGNQEEPKACKSTNSEGAKNNNTK